ncbi:MAG: S9 family peptidase [Planctomycetes bacterium]|nr:S9 family peptidase [Planctomycetota bacterium]
MLRTLAIGSFASLSLIAQEAAPRPVPLQPIDLFRLDFQMVMPAEQPRGWLDADHYLVFDAGPKAMPGQGRPQWRAVEARTGKRRPHLDHAALGKALRALGLDAEDLDVALRDPDAWTWSADHRRCVVAIADDLFAAGLDGAAVRLTDTPDEAEVGVSFSPDGQWIAFVAGHNLHVVPAQGGEVRALTTAGHEDLLFGRLDWVYQEELYGRGNFQGYWWSPDGARIALLRLDEEPVEEFVLVSDHPARPEVETTNYPKVGEPNPIADLGVVDVATGELRWFDLSTYPDEDRLLVRVTWAPDGKDVLFQVQNREQTWLDMLAGDAASGAWRKLWREDSDCWVEAGPEPLWVGGGAEFLWPSESDGYRHLYRFGRDGAARGRLTQGEWQVKKVVAVDEAAGWIYVTADKDSPLQTHLYRVPLAGGEPQRITKGRGTHDVDMAPDRRTFVTTWSSAVTPPCTSLRDLEDRELRAIATSRPELLERHGAVVPEFVQVPARDGFPMEAMLLKPPAFDGTQPFPVVQFTYAGPHTPRVRDEWGGRDQLWHQLLVQRGYVVFVCDNRSASGKGRVFAKACWRKPGQSELRDLEDAVGWLVAQGIADPARIAIWGWSYGGYQTLYNLTHSTKWKCGVAVNAVTDWRLYDTIYTERYFGLPDANEEGYERGSVVAAAGDLHGSLLLLCGAMDDNVHMQNSLQFLWALQQAGKDCDFMVYPRVRHGIEDLQQQLHLFARFERFLREKL